MLFHLFRKQDLDNEQARKDREALMQARLERKLRKRQKVWLAANGYEKSCLHNG